MTMQKRKLMFSREYCGHVKSPRKWPRLVDYGDSHSADCEGGGRDFSVPFSAVLQKALADHATVAMDTGILSGAPRVAGTRIPLYMIIDAVLHYGSIQGAQEAYSDLTIDQIRDALAFAGDVLEHRVEQ